MPEISHFYGIFIYMYFSEHNPPHFHVKYNEYTAEISIKDGIVTGSLPRRALNRKLGTGRTERKFHKDRPS